jgi:serine phosphatase RsbU (regulator of sigma subunit)
MTTPPPAPLEHHRTQAREYLCALNRVAEDVLNRPDMYGHEMLCVYGPAHGLLWHLIKAIEAANWPRSYTAD